MHQLVFSASILYFMRYNVKAEVFDADFNSARNAASLHVYFMRYNIVLHPFDPMVGGA